MSSQALKKEPSNEALKTIDEFINDEARELSYKTGIGHNDAFKLLTKVAMIGKNKKYSSKYSDLLVGSPPLFQIDIITIFDVPKNVLTKDELISMIKEISNIILNGKLESFLESKSKLQVIIEDHKFTTPFNERESKEFHCERIKDTYKRRKTNLTVTGVAPTLVERKTNTEILYKSVLHELENFNLNIEFPPNYNDERIEDVREAFCDFKLDVISLWENKGITDITPILSLLESQERIEKKDIKNILLLEKQEHPEVYRSQFDGTRLFSNGGLHSLFTFLIEHIAKIRVSEALRSSQLINSEIKDSENYISLFNYLEEQHEDFNSSCLQVYTLSKNNENVLNSLITICSDTIKEKKKIQEDILTRVNEFLSKKFKETLSTKQLYFSFEDIESRAQKRVKALNGFHHSPNFQRVSFVGTDYKFGPKQSLVIEALYNHFKESPGNQGLTHETLIAVSESKSKRANLRELFRSNGRTHDAWSKLIKYDKDFQTYKLALLELI